MDQKQVINVQVYRSPSPDKEDNLRQGSYKNYKIAYVDRMTVMSVCDYIQKNIDRSLAYYKSCRIGKCTGCLLEVDGKNMLACSTLAEDGMKIAPAKGKNIIRDLLVEL